MNEKQKDDPSFGVQHTSFFFSFLFSVPKDRKFKGSVAGSVVSKKKGGSTESIPFFFLDENVMQLSYLIYFQ